LHAIKLKIPSFQDKNKPEAYLEWEKKVDWILDYHLFGDKESEAGSHRIHGLCTDLVGLKCD
jgi:hypothetical protein